MQLCSELSAGARSLDDGCQIADEVHPTQIAPLSRCGPITPLSTADWIRGKPEGGGTNVMPSMESSE